MLSHKGICPLSSILVISCSRKGQDVFESLPKLPVNIPGEIGDRFAAVYVNADDLFFAVLYGIIQAIQLKIVLSDCCS